MSAQRTSRALGDALPLADGDLVQCQNGPTAVLDDALGHWRLPAVPAQVTGDTVLRDGRRGEMSRWER